MADLMAMADPIEHAALEGKHCLVVERQDEASETPTVLRRLGARVSVANDAAGASLLARREEFDLAFIALGLGPPIADEVLRRL